MLIPSYSKQFAKDLKKMLKRGKSDEKIKKVIRKLINEEQLETRYKNHRLLGNYQNSGYRDGIEFRRLFFICLR